MNYISSYARSLLKELGDLIHAYQLPKHIFELLLWHVLATKEIRIDEVFRTTVVEDIPDEFAFDGDDSSGRFLCDSYREGLSDIPGTLVVVRMIVNEYTTKKETTDLIWDFIQSIKENRAPNRRRTDDDLMERFNWFRANRLEQLTQEEVSRQFNVNVRGIQMAIQELDKLMKPQE